jgi:plastocyanin
VLRRLLIAASLASLLLVSAAARAATPGNVVITATSTFLPPTVLLVHGTQLQYANADAFSLHGVVEACGASACSSPRFSSALAGFGKAVPVGGTDGLAPGTYTFTCSIHVSMRGTLVVV